MKMKMREEVKINKSTIFNSDNSLIRFSST